MASDFSFVQLILDQSQLADRLTYRRLFGEYALYLADKVVAFACDNSLFVKPTEATTQLTAHLPQAPPYPGAKPYPIADELLDEPEQLCELLLATERALPAPKPKRSRKRPKTRNSNR